MHVLLVSKHVVISSCFVTERICSGVGLGGRVARVLAKSPSHRAARNGDRGFGLESVSVRETRCSGESACISCEDRGLLFGECWGFYFEGGNLPIVFPRLKIGRGVCSGRILRFVPM